MSRITTDEKTEPPALKKNTTVIETTEQHLQRHTPRQEWRSCARCAYYHHRASLEKACSFEEEHTRERLCYLIEAPDLGNSEWGVGCVICRWATFKTPFAQCKIRSLALLHKKSKLQRHVESTQHKRALEQWHRARAPKALPTAGLTATKEAINGEASPNDGREGGKEEGRDGGGGSSRSVAIFGPKSVPRSPRYSRVHAMGPPPRSADAWTSPRRSASSAVHQMRPLLLDHQEPIRGHERQPRRGGRVLARWPTARR